MRLQQFFKSREWFDRSQIVGLYRIINLPDTGYQPDSEFKIRPDPDIGYRILISESDCVKNQNSLIFIIWPYIKKSVKHLNVPKRVQPASTWQYSYSAPTIPKILGVLESVKWKVVGFLDVLYWIRRGAPLLIYRIVNLPDNQISGRISGRSRYLVQPYQIVLVSCFNVSHLHNKMNFWPYAHKI